MNGTPRTAAEEADHGLAHRRQRPPLPGRPRRRRLDGRPRKRHFLQRCFAGWWNDLLTQFSSLALAVCLWYSLGIVSIGSSKLLLSTQKIPPLCLTLQQFVIGSTFVRILLKSRCLSSPGLQPWPTTASPLRRPAYYYGEADVHTSPRSLLLPKGDYQFLTLAGVYFCGGFLATNYGFSGSSAAFVETIKAAEPITSATVAVLWGIESLNQSEVISLVTIVVGVLLSTLGNRPSDTETATLADSARACLIVMASNLCFSFRGLYQKLFRATSEGGTAVIDDLNLQFRMQQLGSYLLFVPVVVFHGPSFCQRLLATATSTRGISLSDLFHYMVLSLVNGCAFASYNLASTFILSRISVVHHAALNCIRRIFAIIVTSLLFQIPFTWIGAMGIGLSFLGFMSFTHFKVQKQKQPPSHASPLLPVNTPSG
ncbi:hypothetical protein FisN_13Hh190 [Fistulifera solaris]|uniref:Sugar phosphate transporter domain-containing protein n=1 Tax=Fistulifera solaris TaxID=1519565 RepID=A0A1Z5KN01_FISSO|nr:hypothetical protein FisN_13Hh190 [Fistulifera solaris]|eukprot:GAX27713.1 hypothetical protein FisN_13Hh190 [Fistulifera solaris]